MITNKISHANLELMLIGPLISTRFIQITDSLNYKSRQRKQNTTGQRLPCWLVGTLKANYQPNLSQIKNTIAPIYLNICLVWTRLCLKLGKSLLPLTQFRTTTNPSKTGRSLMVSSRIMIHKRIFSQLPEEERVRGKSSHNWILYSCFFGWMNEPCTYQGANEHQFKICIGDFIRDQC